MAHLLPTISAPIILETKAFYNGNVEYRISLIPSRFDSAKDEPVVRVEQPFHKDGEEERWGGVGQWYLETLLEDERDELCIDYGQSWFVTGMKAVYQEAKEKLGLIEPKEEPVIYSIEFEEFIVNSLKQWPVNDLVDLIMQSTTANEESWRESFMDSFLESQSKN